MEKTGDGSVSFIDGKTEKLNTYSYKNGNGRLKGITYANGHNVKMTYNGYGQIMAEKWYSATGDLIADYKYTYDGDGNIVRSIDILSKKEYTYIYERGRITKAVEFNVVINSSTGLISSRTAQNTIFYFYDSSDKLRQKKIVPASGTEIVYKYDSADDDSSVMRIQLEDKTITTHSKNDSFGRKEFDELQFETGYISRKFDYCLGKPTQTHIDEGKVKSTATTQLVSNITFSNGRTISYEYDNEERITSVTDSIDGTTTYTYDALGQLTSETYAGVTTLYQYDNYGNITAKGISDGNCGICAESKVEYTYGDGVWKDLLTEYDGQAITYDAQGNPLSYLGHTLTWEKGRQLKSFGTTTYTYNANGIRTSKKVNGVTHTYLLDGTKVLQESWGNQTLAPMYDHNDEVCGIVYNGMPFYFLKNLQGDIIEIIDSSNNAIGRYSYNAWGKCTVTYTNGYDVVAVNPYRYRGYYYDSEIGLYYVSSRYYDPEIGRWISPEPNVYYGEFDEAAGLLGYNVYAYCANNPVNFLDDTGESITAILIGIGIGALVGALAGWGYAKYFKIPKNKTWKYVLGGALIGAAIGGCIGYAVGGTAGSGAVLWSGKSQGMDAIAKAFAKKNGLKVLESTMRGRLLNALSKKLSWKVMEPLWKSASTRFLLKYAGKQTYVHIFISASAYGNMQSVFNTVELQVIAELGMKIIWHYYK